MEEVSSLVDHWHQKRLEAIYYLSPQCDLNLLIIFVLKNCFKMRFEVFFSANACSIRACGFADELCDWQNKLFIRVQLGTMKEGTITFGNTTLLSNIEGDEGSLRNLSTCRQYCIAVFNYWVSNCDKQENYDAWGFWKEIKSPMNRA